MIAALLRVTWLRLTRDPVALALTFVLPLVFFTIFASVFSSMDPGSLRPVAATLVVDEASPLAASIADRLAAEPRLDVERLSWDQRDAALAAVHHGRSAVVVLLPADLRVALAGDDDGDGGDATASAEAVEIHADRADPLAGAVVEGLVRSAIAGASVAALGLPPIADASPVPLRLVDALGRSGKRPSIAFFAAGLGVLFLMFSVTGRSSILVEERENGILRRLLTTRLGLVHVLATRWLFLGVLGLVQVTVMFLWAAIGFGLDLFTARALTGFAAVTVVTSAAAAAFGLVLSSLCRTRAQLSGVAVVVVLTLCALGGNLFPSFLMPERLQAIGQWTFNAWALSAYQKIFWYERPVVELAGELSALGVASVVFFAVAVLLARRRLHQPGAS